MTGAVIAALSVAGNAGGTALPTWANISGAHGSSPANGDQNVSGGSVAFTVTWSVPSPALTLSITDGTTVANSNTGTLTHTYNPATTIHFVAGASGALGPVTITVNAIGYTSSTFTVTLT